MPETFTAQLAGLAEYADRNAGLAPAAALRGRAARRTLRRRGGAAALLGGGALAVATSHLPTTRPDAGSYTSCPSPPHSPVERPPSRVHDRYIRRSNYRTSRPVIVRPISIRWMSDVPSKIVKILAIGAVSAGQRPS